MRILFGLIMFFLFAQPLKATTFTFEIAEGQHSGSWQIFIDADPQYRFNLSIGPNGGPVIIGPDTTFDPASYSTTLLSIGVSGSNGYIFQTYNTCSEFDFHCSRGNRVQSTPDFIVGDGILNVFASEQIGGPYAFYGPLSVSIFIPDRLNAYIAAVPEPSTWAMLLIGFAGIGYTAYRSRPTIGPSLGGLIMP